MDALAMEFPDDSFDLVWACESGEHMPDKKAYVEEMSRVLAPGGQVGVIFFGFPCVCGSRSVQLGRVEGWRSGGDEPRAGARRAGGFGVCV
jgi:ubiquinone/menaquinone biosynthesis C-methylase UbiE